MKIIVCLNVSLALVLCFYVYLCVYFYSKKFFVISFDMGLILVAPLIVVLPTFFLNKTIIEIKWILVLLVVVLCALYIFRYKFRIYNVRNINIKDKLYEEIKKEHGYKLDAKRGLISDGEMNIEVIFISKDAIDVKFSGKRKWSKVKHIKKTIVDLLIKNNADAKTTKILVCWLVGFTIIIANIFLRL